VLLFGDTGVGKSTWINAFANYCKFSSPQEAIQAGGQFPIPYGFQVIDPETNETKTVKSDPNFELGNTGESITVNPVEYSFTYECTKINFIDTPGLNDTKNTYGNDVDKQHINNILRLLSSYDEIHAICILVRICDVKLTQSLKYTLTEIMRRIDTGACNNVVFIFTYASTKNFEPDDTQILLQKFMKDNDLPILLLSSDSNKKPPVFCFENNIVDYLVKCKNKIPQSDDSKKKALDNWKNSVESTKAILEHICSLKPHSLASIHAIYSAEHTIGVVSKLVLEVLLCMFKHVDDLEATKRRLTDNPADVAREASVVENKVRHKRLGHVNVVCQNAKCCKLVNGEIVHKICCEKCSSKWLYLCSKIDWKGTCKVCGCAKSKHDWTKTKTEIVSETVFLLNDSDRGTQNEINIAIAACENRVEECNEETGKMLRTCAKLNSFVRQKALLVSSDADELEKSLQSKIEMYKTGGERTARELEYLEQIQDQYEKILVHEKINRYRECDVYEQIQQLYTLPMKGSDLRTAMKEEDIATIEVIREGRRTGVVRVLSKIIGKKEKAAGSTHRRKLPPITGDDHGPVPSAPLPSSPLPSLPLPSPSLTSP